MGQYYKPCLRSAEAKNWKGYYSWDFDCGLKLMEHSYVGNSFVEYVKSLLYQKPMQVVWAGDYADNEPGFNTNLYDLAKECKRDESRRIDGKLLQFAVNHTKKQYVDLFKLKRNKHGYQIDALPLLTADGNGRGGGDYHGCNVEMVGIWARDMISIESVKPFKGYEEIQPDFFEDW